ncbi:V-type ATP synthase subunit K [Haloimpatiens sp. FM7330]|uniref:V-type ATP synthase subunit K n=1 Tax=Haloimpatiens sp. FM7330 TaxID=3298610 RepID=UPI00364225A0
MSNEVFKTFMEFLNQHGGLLFALLGAALATALPGIGSARGIGLVGQSASGVITEDPDKFGKSIILDVLPGTQGLYGFVITLMILTKIGILGGSTPDLGTGFFIFMGSLPIALVGWKSAIAQGKTAAASTSILAKRPEHVMKGVIYAVMVETYALLAFVISLFVVLNL